MTDPTVTVDGSATPAAQGFAMPAEWERHEATWLAWPHKEDSWPGKFDRIPPVFVEMVRALSAGERVRILVRSRGERSMPSGAPASNTTRSPPARPSSTSMELAS